MSSYFSVRPALFLLAVLASFTNKETASSLSWRTIAFIYSFFSLWLLVMVELACLFCWYRVLSRAAYVCFMCSAWATSILKLFLYLSHVIGSWHIYCCPTYFFLCCGPNFGACLTSNQYWSLISYWSIQCCSSSSCLVYWWPPAPQFPRRSWGTLPRLTGCDYHHVRWIYPPRFCAGRTWVTKSSYVCWAAWFSLTLWCHLDIFCVLRGIRLIDGYMPSFLHIIPALACLMSWVQR